MNVKKLSLLLAAVAVFATAVPAIASAAPTVTKQAGVSAPVGSLLTATNVGPVKITSSLLGTIECETLDIREIKLTLNAGGLVNAESNGAFSTADCTSGTKDVTVTTVKLEKTSSSVAGKGTTNFTISLDVVGGLSCTYTGTNVPFTYVVAGNHMTFNKAGPVDGAPAGCGSATFDATYTLEIGSTDVILD